MRPFSTTTFLAILLLLTGQIDLSAQADAEVANSTAMPGTEFFVSFPPSDPDAPQRFMGLMITSEFATSGTIEVPDVESITNPWDTIRSTRTRLFSVEPGQITYIEIPRLVEPFYPDPPNANLTHNGEISLRSVRVNARAPISVVAVNARQGSSGAYAALPVDQWGTDYLPVSLPAIANNRELTSQLVITAAHDGTVVEVYPSARSGPWNTGERIPAFTLNRGEIWLLEADALPGTPGKMDLSGTTISASKPIGVVAGHRHAALSKDPQEVFARSTYGSWHAEAQMPIEGSESGREYLSTPIRQDGDRFRLMALENNTVVSLALLDNNGAQVGTTSVQMRWRGQVVDVSAPDGLRLDRPIRWTSSKPFSLYQIRTSGGNYPDPESRSGFLRLVPTEQGARRVVAALPGALDGFLFSTFTTDLVVLETDNPLSDVSLGGTPLADLDGVTVTTTPLGNRSWHVSLEMTSGSHVFDASNGARIIGRVSGAASPESGVALDFTLEHWNPAIDLDRSAPTIVASTNPDESTVSLTVSDRTENYFSGVAAIEIYESPGWERRAHNVSLDPDLDATAIFAVRQGVDPSGPLQVRLIDRDGNERIEQVHDGVCLQSAYAATDSLVLNVTSDQSVVGEISIAANPCGDAARITLVTLDVDGTANSDLESPILEDGSATWDIDAGGKATIRVRTRAGLYGEYRKTTSLIVRIEDAVITVPVILDVNAQRTSVEEGRPSTPSFLDLSAR